MPNLDSAKKELRKNERRRAINDRWRRKLREALKEVRSAINTKDAKKADTAYTTIQSIIDRAARRNIIPPNAAARKKARLQQAIKKISA